jgi:hypothetical protein
MAGFDRNKMLKQLERLREVMDEDEIFIQGPDHRVYLSPKASRKLAAFAVEDAEAWWAEHHDSAAEAAASILEQFQK